MLFKYPLTDQQYARFQHANNNDQIQAIAAKAGVVVTDETIENGVETMHFTGRCKGTMALVWCKWRDPDSSIEVPHDHWECWIQVRSKPWWLPWRVLDWGFRRALV